MLPPGAPMSGLIRVVETLYVALSEALPERVPAGSKGMICHVGFGGRNHRHEARVSDDRP